MPSQVWLANNLGVTVRTIWTWTQILINKGFIRTRRGPKGRSGFYQIRYDIHPALFDTYRFPKKDFELLRELPAWPEDQLDDASTCSAPLERSSTGSSFQLKGRKEKPSHLSLRGDTDPDEKSDAFDIAGGPVGRRGHRGDAQTVKRAKRAPLAESPEKGSRGPRAAGQKDKSKTRGTNLSQKSRVTDVIPLLPLPYPSLTRMEEMQRKMAWLVDAGVEQICIDLQTTRGGNQRGGRFTPKNVHFFGVHHPKHFTKMNNIVRLFAWLDLLMRHKRVILNCSIVGNSRVLMLDDMIVVPKGLDALCMETSVGKYQWLIKTQSVMTSDDYLNVARAITARGVGDSACISAGHLFRAIGSLNFKYDTGVFATRLVGIFDGEQLNAQALQSHHIDGTRMRLGALELDAFTQREEMPINGPALLEHTDVRHESEEFQANAFMTELQNMARTSAVRVSKGTPSELDMTFVQMLLGQGANPDLVEQRLRRNRESTAGQDSHDLDDYCQRTVTRAIFWRQHKNLKLTSTQLDYLVRPGHAKYLYR